MKAVHLRIHGIVQGVWYRASTKEVADLNGLAGWVRNTPDGSVEAFAQGPEKAVNAFLDWCWRGPAGARVDQVDVSHAEPETGLHGFAIRR
jgi:acylphosphatase